MSTINNSSLKIKRFFETKTAHDLYIVLIIILVAFGSFGLGRLSKIEDSRTAVKISYPDQLQAGVYGAFSVQETQPYQEQGTSSESDFYADSYKGNFVASKNSDKYHFPWCSGAKRIKEENKVWFETHEEAKAAGYTKAANCKGL